MRQQPNSLKREYELYVEQEIESYKESVSRGVLLRIGDEAVGALQAQQQLALTEVLLVAEVDRIIRQRLRVPTYRTWCRRRLKALEEFRRPERWGLRPDGAVARTVPLVAEGHVLVAGSAEEGPAVYLAANGCAVTAIESAEEVMERVMHAAVEVGIAGRVRGFIGHVAGWTPDRPLNAVICAAAAFAGLTDVERAAAIALLQGATTDGGVHVLHQGPSQECDSPTLDELATSYDGWQVTVERSAGATQTILARKLS
jgi:hypothetical protein